MTKVSISISNALFIGSYNEFGYKRVLDSFKNAKYIMISSYNIDERIIKTLDRCHSKTNICIVTNIPSRFNSYFNEHAKKTYKLNLEKYLNALNPSNFQSQSMDVWFNFHNHSKIIMTDKIAYIGSQNFSTGSTNNYESGFIVSDSNSINEIKEKFFDLLIEQSINYRAPDLLIELARNINEIAEEFKKELDILHESLYIPYDDYPFFKDDVWYLSLLNQSASLNEIDKCIEKINSFTSDILIEIENIKNDFLSVSTPFSSSVEEIINSIIFSLNNQTERIDEVFEEVESLEYFKKNENDMAMEILQEKYSLEAHDEESLQHYLELSMSEAHEIFSGYVDCAENEIKEIERYILLNSENFIEIETLIINLANRALDNT